MSEVKGKPSLGLEPLGADEWGEKEYAAFGALLGIPGEKVPRAGSGHRADPVRFKVVGLLARHPELAGAFLTLNRFLLQHGALPLRLRELAILRVTQTRRSAYLWGEHVKVATDGGISSEDVANLAGGSSHFAGADRLVLEATDEMLTAGRIQAETWQTLVEELDTHQGMELIFVVGTWATLAMAFDTWGLTPESGSPPLP